MWPEKHRGAYRIRDRVAGRIVTLASGYPTKAAARDGMALLTADALRGEALVPRGGQTLLADLIDAWWPTYERALKPTTAHSEGGRVRNHIRHLLGGYALDEVDVPAVERWVGDLSAGRGTMPDGCKSRRRPLAPKTVHNCHGLLFVIMDYAIACRLIKVNPCASKATYLPKREPREMRFLSDPEIARLVAATPPHWRPLVLLLVATGLRWGEAIGLRAGRVDLLAARPKLLVVEQLQEMSGTGELVFQSPKTARSRRTVTFPRSVAAALAALHVGKAAAEMLFATPTGLPVRTRNFRRVWLKACRDAGLEGLRVHDLRHTHAAILIAANRPLSAISRRLGHSSIAVTDALYGHLREEVDEGILSAVDDALALALPVEVEVEVEVELLDPLA